LLSAATTGVYALTLDIGSGKFSAGVAGVDASIADRL
jgi:hypothetical protein